MLKGKDMKRDWQDFLNAFNRAVEMASHHKLKQLSKRIYREMKERYPRTGLKCELVDKGFTQEEFSLFLSHVEDEKIKACFILMAYLGLRVGELTRLKKNDLDGNKLRINAEKGSYSAYLTLPDVLVNLIQKHKGRHLKLIDVSNRQLSYSFDLYRKKAGLDEVYSYSNPAGKNRNFTRPLYRFSLHSLRHFGIQQVYERSKNPELARKFARHRKIQTTLGYFRKNNAQEIENVIAQMISS